MLEFRNINIMLKQNNRMLLEKFNFVLGREDKAVIIGEEGNGKSTLLKLAYDMSLVDKYASVQGEIGKNKLLLGYLPQEMSSEFLEYTVLEFFEKDLAQDQINDPVLLTSILAQLNISYELVYSDQKIKTLSGGEKVKVGIAKMLLGEPDVLLLDEPTNDVDIACLTWLENFINRVNRPVLFVSHDETLIENTANVIIHIEQIKGKTCSRYAVQRMPYSEYIETRAYNIQKQGQIANKQRDEYEEKEKRFKEIYQKVETAQRNNSRQDPHGSRLLKKKMKSLKSQEKRLDKQEDGLVETPDIEDPINIKFSDEIMLPKGKVVLDFSLDCLEVGEEQKVLSRDIKITVVGNKHVGIVGENGVGKTTLLKKIGQQLLDRTDIKTFYMPQNYDEYLDYNLTPIEFLSAGKTKDEITKARTYMGSLRYTRDEMASKISGLSGGQKAKLLFLSMVLDGYNVLVLDEPTRNFSPLSNPVIRSILSSYRGAIISVTHDRKYISEVCDEVYTLTDNGLVKP